MDYSLSSLENASPKTKAAAAALVFESFPEFYAFFGAKKAVLDAIVEQFGDDASELGAARVLAGGGEVGGVYCAYPSREIPARQLASLKTLAEAGCTEKSLWTELGAFRGTVEPLARPGFYLARIAVAKRRRGAGLGRRLLSEFEREAKRRRFPAALAHVKSDNAPALGFYRAAGYRRLSSRRCGYQVMAKDL